MYALRSIAFVALWLLLTLTNTGCFTMMGAGLDAIRGERYETGPGWQVAALKPGTTVTLRLRDSTRVSGTYAGLATQNPDAYAHRYAAWQAQPEGAAFPAIGERITVVRSFGRRTEVEFQGFDYGDEKDARDPNLYLLVKRPGQDKLERMRLKKGLRMADSLGTPMVTDSLKTMSLNGGLPILSTITLIPADTVRVEIDSLKTMSLNGGLPILSTITLIPADTVRVEIDRVAFITRSKRWDYSKAANIETGVYGVIAVVALVRWVVVRVEREFEGSIWGP